MSTFKQNRSDMVILLLEFLCIIAYMFNGILGVVVMFLLTIYVLLKTTRTQISKLLTLVILSLPMSFIGIGGIESSHIYSWYHLYLILLMLIFCSKRIYINRSVLLCCIVIIISLTISNAYAVDVAASTTDTIQALLMLIPIALLLSERFSACFDLQEVEHLITLHIHTCVVTSCALIVQVLLYGVGIKSGIVLLTAGRVSFFVLYKGASILPIYLGTGLVLSYTRLLNFRKNTKEIVAIAIIAIAMILSNSRTGFVAFGITVFLMTLPKLLKNITLKSMIVLIVMVVMLGIGAGYILSQRTSLTGLLDDNGRISGYILAMNTWSDSLWNFLFGVGFGDYAAQVGMKPHNAIIQTLAENGIIITMIVIGMFTKFLWINRKNKYSWAVCFVLISQMMVTDFYANAFFTIIIVLTGIYGIKIRSVERPLPDDGVSNVAQ